MAGTASATAARQAGEIAAAHVSVWLQLSGQWVHADVMDVIEDADMEPCAPASATPAALLPEPLRARASLLLLTSMHLQVMLGPLTHCTRRARPCHLPVRLLGPHPCQGCRVGLTIPLLPGGQLLLPCRLVPGVRLQPRVSGGVDGCQLPASPTGIAQRVLRVRMEAWAVSLERPAGAGLCGMNPA